MYFQLILGTLTFPSGISAFIRPSVRPLSLKSRRMDLLCFVGLYYSLLFSFSGCSTFCSCSKFYLRMLKNRKREVRKIASSMEQCFLPLRNKEYRGESFLVSFSQQKKIGTHFGRVRFSFSASFWNDFSSFFLVPR